MKRLWYLVAAVSIVFLSWGACHASKLRMVSHLDGPLCIPHVNCMK